MEKVGWNHERRNKRDVRFLGKGTEKETRKGINKQDHIFQTGAVTIPMHSLAADNTMKCH